MRRVFEVIAAAVAMMTVAGGSAVAQDTLKAGTECTYFPFNFRDTDGTLKGYDVDVGNELAKRLKFKIEWVCQDRKSTRLNSSHVSQSRMPSSA